MDRVKLKQVWHQVHQIAAADREKFLLEACSQDTELRLELESLLRMEAEASAFLETPALLGLPARIGPWLPIRKLGSGGMGTVYLAIRTSDGIEQQAALKRIENCGTDLRLQHRFRQERRILARLDHQAIAKFLDAGEDEAGQPYLVMEYADGQRLDDWARSTQATTRTKLELFANICDAVHYAHQRLIVHRDLKPSNIIVTQDGKPKLLDFGIAKLLTEVSAGVTALYATPFYAAPEQLEGEPATTAADVYSLGAILFELLTGNPPTKRAQLGQEHGPDLAAIVAKALDREPVGRYASAQAMAEDIRRFLQGHVIAARPLSGWRSAIKAFQRNRTAFALGGLALFVILGISAYAWKQATLAQRTYIEARQINSKLLWKVERALREKTPTDARAILLSEASASLAALRALGYQDPDFLAELASSYANLGTALAEGVAPEGSRVEAAFQDGASLAPADAQNLELRFARAKLELRWAQALARQGGDNSHLALATRLLTGLQAQGIAEAATELVVAKMLEGDRYAALGQWGLLEQSRNELVPLAKSAPLRVDRGQNLLSIAEKKLAAVLSFRGKSESALPHYLAALAIDRKEFAARPEISQRLDLATSLSEIGGVHLAMAKPDLALPYLEESATLRQEAFAMDRGSARVKFAYSNVLQRLGHALYLGGRADEGEVAFRKAEDVAITSPPDEKQFARILTIHARALLPLPLRRSEAAALQNKALSLFAAIEKRGDMDAPLRAEWQKLQTEQIGKK